MPDAPLPLTGGLQVAADQHTTAERILGEDFSKNGLFDRLHFEVRPMAGFGFSTVRVSRGMRGTSTMQALTMEQQSESAPRGIRIDDGDLVAALKAGSRRAAETLAEQTYRGIHSALFRLCGGDGDLAAELTQETYRRAWSALESFRGKARFSTWLYRIAYTTFLNHLRRPRPFVSLEDEPPPPEGESTEAEAVLDDRRRRRSLRRAVLDLPDELRYTVTARYWGGHSARDIAKTEGITATAVRKRLRKASQLLAATLQEEAP
jgi:RNA polymerase sigma-70 factor (ECF subfamily)